MILSMCLCLMLLQDPSAPVEIITSPIHSFSGEEQGDLFGDVLALVGDVNQDGCIDFAVGAPGRAGPMGPMTGAVHIYSGMTGESLGLFNGQYPFDRFGKSIACTELNDDGCSDVIIGAPYFSPPRRDGCGRVYVISVQDKKRILTLNGKRRGDFFGFSLAAMDMNSDGIEDILVGAPGCDGDERQDGGSVYLFSGADGTVLGLLDGEREGDWFGYSLCCIDANADGFGDCLVSAPGRDSETGLDQGMVYAYSGQNAQLLYTTTLGPGTDRFGLQLGPLRDLNQDGIQDFMASGLGKEEARVGIFNGADGKLLFFLPVENPALPLAPTAFSVEDLDHDRIPDLVLGCGGGKAGTMTLHSGKDGSPLLRLDRDPPLVGAGYRVCGPIKEGFPEYLTLAAAAHPFLNRGDEEPGRVELFSLAPAGVSRRLVRRGSQTGFGTVLELLQDGNGDGKADLLLGTPLAPNPKVGKSAGGVSVYSLNQAAPVTHLQGNTERGYLGDRVAELKDRDGDGLSDFLISEPGFTLKDQKGVGRVHVFSTARKGLLKKTFTGARAGDRMGASLAVIGDLNNDDIQEFVLGAPGFDQKDRTNAGQIYIVNGKTLQPLKTVKGIYPGGNMGFSLASAGDLDGDDSPEFMCATNQVREGKIVAELVMVISTKEFKPLYILKGEDGRGRFGTALLGVPGQDGARHPYLVVGAPGRTGPAGQGAGRVYFFHGQDGSLLAHLDGEEEGGHFGKIIALVPDLDQDGFDEIAISADERIYLFRGSDFSLFCKLEGEEGTTDFGCALLGNRYAVPDGKDPLFYVGARKLALGIKGNFGVVYGYGKNLKPLEEEAPSMPIHYNK